MPRIYPHLPDAIETCFSKRNRIEIDQVMRPRANPATPKRVPNTHKYNEPD